MASDGEMTASSRVPSGIEGAFIAREELLKIRKNRFNCDEWAMSQEKSKFQCLLDH